MVTVLWSIVGFVVGSIPFSLIMGRLVAKIDVRNVGDGNPGGANALRAGGIKAGIPAILLDIAKGFFPVFFAQRYGVAQWDLIPVCLAPILGHAFSPFLRFHGGKALGATAGVWFALIGPLALLIYAALAVPFTLVQVEDAWSANAGMLALLGYVFSMGVPWMALFVVCNMLLIAWTHRHQLFRPSRFRPWLTRLYSGRGA